MLRAGNLEQIQFLLDHLHLSRRRCCILRYCERIKGQLEAMARRSQVDEKRAKRGSGPVEGLILPDATV